MKVWLERQPDGRSTIEIDTEAHPDAQVLYDLISDIKPWPDSLLEGAEQARHPKRLTAANVPFFTGNETEAQVTPDGVCVENMWTGGKIVLSHQDFVTFVETYQRLLESRRGEPAAEREVSGGAGE